MLFILKDIYILKERQIRFMPLSFGAKNNDLIVKHRETIY